MRTRKLTSTLGLLAMGLPAGLALAAPAAPAPAAKPTNFLFILADDMGWNQTGYGGSTFYETPNIDRIAREGIRFTRAYCAAPICTPSRASILTGRYPARIHLTEYIPGDPYPWAKLLRPDEEKMLPLSEITIPEMLKPKGYVSAMIGKWHLAKDYNYTPGRPGEPASQGFDVEHLTVKPEEDSNPNNDAHHVVEITNEAVKFLEANRDRPFFCYVAHNVVHRPIMEHADLIYKYREKQASDLAINNAIMGAMIERMDTGIGVLLKKLDELGLADHTVVVFFSDNGGYDKLQSQDPLRGGKSMLYEGGVRVPMAIRWPGVVKPGTVTDVPVIGCDFFPTFAEIAGITSFSQKIDGVSLVPLLRDGRAPARDALFWHYPHYHRFNYQPSGAIRVGDYKLIEWYERSLTGGPHPVSLFNIKEDVAEAHDLADQMPDLANQLWARLKQWRKDVGAQEMTINPHFDPARALHWSPKVDPNSATSLGLYY
ncbi:MAG TPA: sulfatase [Lacunisphaera sp.]|nr:sulfatase [Lacunisphaera sp.]